MQMNINKKQKILVRIVNNLKAKAVNGSIQHAVHHNRNGKDQIITSENADHS